MLLGLRARVLSLHAYACAKEGPVTEYIVQIICCEWLT